MGAVCYHSELQSSDVVEVLSAPSWAETADVSFRVTSQTVLQLEGDEQAHPESDDEDEETQKVSTVTTLMSDTPRGSPKIEVD